MTLRQAIDDILGTLWLENTATLPDWATQHGLTALNAAFQDLWTHGPDHFRKTEVTFNTVINTRSYTLDSTIQGVLGQVLLNGTTPVRPVLDEGTFRRFYESVIGGDEPSNGTPLAYFLDRRKATSGDICEVQMRLTPKPSAVFAVTFDASSEAPAYTLTTLADTPSVALRLPHGYVESTLLPVARWRITASHLFTNPALVPKLQADAIAVLPGLADTLMKLDATAEKQTPKGVSE